MYKTFVIKKLYLLYWKAKRTILTTFWWSSGDGGVVEMLATLGFTLDVTVPIFLMVLLGWWTGKRGWVGESFTETASKIVFNIALPALLFLKISEADLSRVLDASQLIYALVATIFAAFLCGVYSRFLALPPQEQGVFIQGAFRGNLGIVGIALCGSMYGDEGLAVGSILLAFMTMLYNVISVIALTIPFKGSDQGALKKQLVHIAKNPLIIAILLALLANYMRFELPHILDRSLGYFSGMTLPLALICVGASINSKVLKRSGRVSMHASWLKLVMIPFLATLIAILLGIEGIYLGTLFLMFASPTAAASYVMARQMRGDAELAATIIAVTTAKSVITISMGIFALRALTLA